MEWFSKCDGEKIARKYKNGSKYVLAMVPIKEEGVPTMKFFELLVEGRGLTYGVPGDPAYYFRHLPEEIQEKCSFTPHFGNMFLATEEEKQAIVESYNNALDNLKKLLNG
jgi:hypothetical protein